MENGRTACETGDDDMDVGSLAGKLNCRRACTAYRTEPTLEFKFNRWPMVLSKSVECKSNVFRGELLPDDDPEKSIIGMK